MSQALLLRSKWAFMTRAQSDVKGSTRFKVKGKKKGGVKVDQVKERSKVISTLERYGKILFYPRPIPPVRTAEEHEEARNMTFMRNRKLQQAEFEMRRRETTYIKLRQLAFEELPTESLKNAASELDDSKIPRDFIHVLIEPPLEDEEIFGPPMAGIVPGQDDF